MWGYAAASVETIEVTSSPLALVTGANRGIGFEITRQLARLGYAVILSARDAAKGEAAAAALKTEGLIVSAVTLDVTSADSISAAIADIENKHGPLGVLVNNAGILIDGPGGFESSLFDMTDDTARRTWETNVLGPAHLIKAVLPGMIAHGVGRVVNLSSGAGQLSGMGSGFPAYRMSKSALNALTRVAAAEAGNASGTSNVKINACCPGWVRTSMGGPQATRLVEQGAETPVWLATLGEDGPTGGFFRDKAPIPW